MTACDARHSSPKSPEFCFLRETNAGGGGKMCENLGGAVACAVGHRSAPSRLQRVGGTANQYVIPASVVAWQSSQYQHR
eukprot:366258-Chlamydomonas_euryale.AAC.15